MLVLGFGFRRVFEFYFCNFFFEVKMRFKIYKRGIKVRVGVFRVKDGLIIVVFFLS